METFINFVQNNYQWLLSGIVPSLISFFIGRKVGYNKAIKQNQKLGNQSYGLQVGGSINLGGEKSE